MNESQVFSLFVTCPLGIQYVLERELQALDCEETKATPAGVYCRAGYLGLYKALLWSRTANRVLLCLHSGKVDTGDDVYQVASEVPWEQHFSVDTSFNVQFSGSNGQIRNTTFGALKVKDAIADRFRSIEGRRPNVERKNADISVRAHLSKGVLALYLDLSGDSLHKRHYRQGTGEAPLKENLASAILLLSGWPNRFDEGASLLDPMCGSGTFLIEAAMIAMNIAPGLRRVFWGFDQWKKHDAKIWATVQDQAVKAAEQGRQNYTGRLVGYDKDAAVIRKAWHNVQAADLESWIHVEKRSLEDFVLGEKLNNGLLVCNPPYGERLGEVEALQELYAHLGYLFATYLEGWSASVFTGNMELGKALSWRSHKQYKLFNGAIESQLILLDLKPENRFKSQWLSAEQLLRNPEQWRVYHEERAQMFRNRLKKNMKTLEKWARKSQVTCYRCYDADMPEYSMAIDLYQDQNANTWFHVQEYAPPASLSEKSAVERLSEALCVLRDWSACEGQRIALKTRRVQKGKQQYQKQGNQRAAIQVTEGPATLEVNLHDYLDTGLFLDHRPARRWIHEQAADKRVLNLFCYTASVSVMAALGGASESLSIDMSKTYLAWAQRNFALNHIDENKHLLMQSDCIEWLASAAKSKDQRFDLIFLDPPSFSNSKRMEGVLDVQRDHAGIIRQAMRLLLPGGTLFFSNNLRGFKLDDALQSEFQVSNWARQSFDKDFERNTKIHNAWLIQHQ